MDIQQGHRTAQRMVGLQETVRVEDFTEFFSRAYAKVAHALAAQGTGPVGPAIALYGSMNEDKADVTAGFPVHEDVEIRAEDLVVTTLPAGPTVEAMHVGPYDTLSETYEAVMGWMAQRHLVPGPQMWEEYLSGPGSVAEPAQWRTRIVFPILGS